MKKIESLVVGAILPLCFLCAPGLLTIIGIWMIYNVDPLIGLVIGFIGCAGAGWGYPLAIEEIKKIKEIKKNN